jgi:hypothetical protein
LTLESEPTFDAYMKELVEEEGVILGLEEEPGRNLYFTGRSFLRDPIAPNIHGIDLVWAEEDWYEAGMQGKVLETRARQTDAFYVDYQGGWMKVESMLALSPLYPPGEGPAEACPDLIVVGPISSSLAQRSASAVPRARSPSMRPCTTSAQEKSRDRLRSLWLISPAVRTQSARTMW